MLVLPYVHNVYYLWWGMGTHILTLADRCIACIAVYKRVDVNAKFFFLAVYSKEYVPVI